MGEFVNEGGAFRVEDVRRVRCAAWVNAHVEGLVRLDVLLVARRDARRPSGRKLDVVHPDGRWSSEAALGVPTTGLRARP